MTLFQLWDEGAGILKSGGNPDAKEDARQLLLAAFHLDTAHYLLKRMQELPDDESTRFSLERFRKMVEERGRRRPLQQILGSQEFMGIEFYVNHHVLIPRQDTETLVELVINEQPDRDKKVLDLCTGSGCIAVSLAVRGGFRNITATDISKEALEVARRNVRANGCADSVCLLRGDLFAALETSTGQEAATGEGEEAVFDILTSNPPYIPTAVIQTLEPEVKDHEPILALDGTEDGLFYYRRIASGARRHLAAGGFIYLEIGHDQGAAVSGIFEAEGYREIRVCKDLTGNDRVVCARR